MSIFYSVFFLQIIAQHATGVLLSAENSVEKNFRVNDFFLMIQVNLWSAMSEWLHSFFEFLVPQQPKTGPCIAAETFNGQRDAGPIDIASGRRVLW